MKYPSWHNQPSPWGYQILLSWLSSSLARTFHVMFQYLFSNWYIKIELMRLSTTLHKSINYPHNTINYPHNIINYITKLWNTPHDIINHPHETIKFSYRDYLPRLRELSMYNFFNNKKGQFYSNIKLTLLAWVFLKVK